MKASSFRGVPSLLAATLASATPALAESVDWAKPYAGEWTLSGVSEGDPYCLITLGDEGAIGGASLEVSATCLRRFPLAEVFAWTLRDNRIVLADAARQPVLTFTRNAEDSYTGQLDDGRQLSFDRGGFDIPEIDEILDGTFGLSGYNQADSCGFYLEAETPREGPLEQAGNCGGVWQDNDWSRWRVEDGKLKLVDSAGTAILTLTRADAFTFTVDGHDGLFFGPGTIETSE